MSEYSEYKEQEKEKTKSFWNGFIFGIALGFLFGVLLSLL